MWGILAAVSSIFALSGTDSSVSLASRVMEIQFSEATGGVTAIRSVQSGHDFIHSASERPLLWRLALRGRDGKEATIDNASTRPPKIVRTGSGITLSWSGVEVPGEPSGIEVVASCRLAAGDDTAQFRLEVHNRTERGLWTVQFPVIGPLSEAGKPDIAIGRGSWGQLYPAAVQPVTGSYPSHNLPMQVILLQEGASGLYLAAHDPTARPKEFLLTPGAEFHALHWADNMGVQGSGWTSPYAFAIGVYSGGWTEGCKRYRAWAVKHAPWTRKGPLARRSDVPEMIRKVSAWIQGSGKREEAVPVVRKYANAVGAPVGVHWYSWHQIPFDTDYPAYLPAKPGFSQGVKELTSEGVLVMPYINARLWDIANAEFPKARPYTCKDEREVPLIEEYGSGAKLAVMCPATSFWQERVGSIVRTLAMQEGVNAVYLDQIGSAAPRLCFDPTHGHPVGSGSWWVDGYRKMLGPLKEWCVSGGRSVALTTENNAEPYMDNVDGFLIWTPRDGHEIPMTAAVYGGYTLYFATNRALTGGDEGFCLLQARDFTWGAQLGWEGAAILEPTSARKLEFQARLAKLRTRAADFLVYGELLDVVRPENPLPTITGKWNTWQGDKPVTLPAVHAALWRGKGGSLAVVLANADTQPLAFQAALDMNRWLPGRANRWKMTLVTREGRTPQASQSGHTIRVDTTVPARDGELIVIEPDRASR